MLQMKRQRRKKNILNHSQKIWINERFSSEFSLSCACGILKLLLQVYRTKLWRVKRDMLLNESDSMELLWVDFSHFRKRKKGRRLKFLLLRANTRQKLKSFAFIQKRCSTYIFNAIGYPSPFFRLSLFSPQDFLKVMRFLNADRKQLMVESDLKTSRNSLKLLEISVPFKSRIVVRSLFAV